MKKSKTLLYIGIVLIIIGASSIIGGLIGQVLDFVFSFVFGFASFVTVGILLIIIWAFVQGKNFSKKHAKKQEMYINGDPNVDLNTGKNSNSDTIFVNITHDTADIPPIRVQSEVIDGNVTVDLSGNSSIKGGNR
jgi:hypothetical protein